MPERHGLTSTPTYRIWAGMRQRCNNPRDAAYANYGGRGIKICERWGSFSQFLADMGPRPPGMTIERRDVNSGYSPDNCCWLPANLQSSNRRNCHRITINDRTMTATDWAREFGVPTEVAIARLGLGWDPVEAVQTPVGTVNHAARVYEHAGVRLNLRQWGRRLGTTATVLRNRLDSGWSVEETFGVPIGQLRAGENRKTRLFLEYRGQRRALVEWAKERNMRYGTLRKRFLAGMTPGQVLSLPD